MSYSVLKIHVIWHLSFYANFNKKIVLTFFSKIGIKTHVSNFVLFQDEMAHLFSFKMRRLEAKVLIQSLFAAVLLANFDRNYYIYKCRWKMSTRTSFVLEAREEAIPLYSYVNILIHNIYMQMPLATSYLHCIIL